MRTVTPRHGGHSRRLTLAAAALAAVILLPLTAATGPYLVYLAIRRTTTIPLPEPDGPYPIGRISQVWTDPQRTDQLSPTQPVQRRLAVWIWYPASPVDTPTSPYTPGEWNRLQLVSRAFDSRYKS